MGDTRMHVARVEAKGGTEAPGAGVRGGCEHQDVDSENWNQPLQKSSMWA